MKTEYQDIDPADGTLKVWPNGKSTPPTDIEVLASVGRERCAECEGTGVDETGTDACWFCQGIGSFRQL